MIRKQGGGVHLKDNRGKPCDYPSDFYLFVLELLEINNSTEEGGEYVTILIAVLDEEKLLF